MLSQRPLAHPDVFKDNSTTVTVDSWFDFEIKSQEAEYY